MTSFVPFRPARNKNFCSGFWVHLWCKMRLDTSETTLKWIWNHLQGFSSRVLMKKSRIWQKKTLVTVQQWKNPTVSKSTLINRLPCNIFAKKPMPSLSSLLPFIVVNDEETSHSVSPATKIWIDLAKQRQVNCWKKKTCEGRRSDSSKRTERVSPNIIELQAAKIGANMTRAPNPKKFSARVAIFLGKFLKIVKNSTKKTWILQVTWVVLKLSQRLLQQWLWQH